MAIEEVEVLWITAGLGCDGDTIAMTAATQPSIEELVGGAFPGVPRLKLHNPVQSQENGDAFMERFRLASAGSIGPFILVVEGSIPNFPQTVHEGCDRGGYYEQADFAAEYGSPRCIVKIGCWGPVVVCNVPKRGWMNGLGGCPNVGGICIGCTMPGFPDKFMPFMDEPPGARMSTSAVLMYGRTVRALRNFTMHSLEKEPDRRARGSDATPERGGGVV